MFDRLATLVWTAAAIVALSGCGRSGSQDAGAKLAKILAEGNQTLEEMKVSGPKQQYRQYFGSYETLQLRYLEAAEALEQDGANATSAQALQTLGEWEAMIVAARNVWHGPELDPPDLPFAGLEPKGNDAADVPTTEFSRLVEMGKESRKQIEANWAPIDAQVNEAMEKMQELRARNK